MKIDSYLLVVFCREAQESQFLESPFLLDESSKDFKKSLEPVLEYRQRLLAAFHGFQASAKLSDLSVRLGAQVISKAITYPLANAFTQMLFVHIRGAPDFILDNFSTLPRALKFLFDDGGIVGLYQGFAPVAFSEVFRCLVTWGAARSALPYVRFALKSSEGVCRELAEAASSQPALGTPPGQRDQDLVAVLGSILSHWRKDASLGHLTTLLATVATPHLLSHVIETFAGIFSINSRIADGLTSVYELPSWRDFLRSYISSYLGGDLALMHG